MTEWIDINLPWDAEADYNSTGAPEMADVSDKVRAKFGETKQEFEKELFGGDDEGETNERYSNAYFKFSKLQMETECKLIDSGMKRDRDMYDKRDELIAESTDIDIQNILKSSKFADEV